MYALASRASASPRSTRPSNRWASRLA